MRVVVISPSTRLSSTPVTVTVWGVFQLAIVKIRVSVLKEFSVVSSPVMETVTLAVGCASRTTVNVEDPPASEVRRSAPEVVPVEAMVMPLMMVLMESMSGLLELDPSGLKLPARSQKVPEVTETTPEEVLFSVGVKVAE